MEAVAVDIDGKVVAELGLQADCIELGGAPHADVVLPELDQTMRGFLVQPIHAGVFVYSLSDVGSAMRATTLCIDKRQVLDGRVGITRIRSEKSQVGARLQTDRINVDPQHRSLSLVLGAGPEARRVLIKRKPLSIGSAPDNDLVLMDRTISRYHCRIETSAIGSVVRDLHSRNGTWLNGARVRHAGLRPGAMIRLGRTNLRIISRDTTPNGSSDCLIAESPAMSTVLADVENFAQLPWPVLILGQSGTGKEKIAQALHLRGPRADKPFVALNAGGLPATLVESELFGHEKGAFTGAIAQHRGVFEQADTGTIFLDEVGELPLALQARLLRVLETWSIRRVGSESDQSVDVRLICATHQDLHKMVSTGRFRQDLYYRINRLYRRSTGQFMTHRGSAGTQCRVTLLPRLQLLLFLFCCFMFSANVTALPKVAMEILLI